VWCNKCCRVEKVDAVEQKPDSVTDEAVLSVTVDTAVNIKFVTILVHYQFHLLQAVYITICRSVGHLCNSLKLLHLN